MPKIWNDNVCHLIEKDSQLNTKNMKAGERKERAGGRMEAVGEKAKWSL